MQKQLSITTKRILVATGFVVAFLVMASIFSPDRTKASNVDLNPDQSPLIETGVNRHYGSKSATEMDWYNPDAGYEESSTDAHQGLRSLGALESVRYSVQIYSTDAGPRYSVYEKKSGKLLDTLLTPAKVQDKYPELNLPKTDFSAETEGALMMAEPASKDFSP